MQDLETEAADPTIDPARLQQLANDYPALRPLIAMNPATYPALVEWLGELGDPAVNVALAQRHAAVNAGVGAPRRVSVLGRTSDSPFPYSPPVGVPSPTPPVEDDSSPSATPVGQAGSLASATSLSQATGSSPVADSPFTYPTGSLPDTGELSAVSSPGDESRKLVILLAIVLTVALVVIGYFLLSGMRAENSSPATTAEGNVPSRETDTPTEREPQDEGSAEGDDTPLVDSDLPVQFPAPESALDLTHIASPSGNITCELGEEAVTCTINSHNFENSNLQTCGAGPLTLTAELDDAGIDCSAQQVSSAGAVPLSYADYATYGNSACVSSQFGVACWNTVSGASFGVAREGYQISLTSPVDPTQFPWN